jgi:N-acetylglucosamine-6-phosphate deacetylase
MTEMNYLYMADGAYTPDIFLEPAVIAVRDGKIAYIGKELEEARAAAPDAPLREFPGCIVAPGFVDLHVHGARGWDFYDCPPAAIADVTKFFARHGTTTLLAAVTTGRLEQMGAAIAQLAEHMTAPEGGARIGGIYLEGPFCSYARRATFLPQYLLEPDWQVLAPWVEEYGWALRFVGLAPELPGAGDVIKKLRSLGIGVCICHSDGDHEDFERAVLLGATHLTHFYNGLAPLHHRRPGIVGGALARGGVTAELIADLHHVHPMAIEILFRCLGPRQICLITDAMRAAGCPPGEYMISEQRAVVREGKALIGESTLAGSLLTMDQAGRNLLSLGYRVADVLTMAAKTPARAAGFTDRGELKPGQLADLVFLDSNYQVAATAMAGEIVFERKD